MNTRRSNDHAVSRITVEARGEVIDGDNGIGIQRQDVEHIGRGNMIEPSFNDALCTRCDIRRLRLGRSGLDPRVEHSNAGLFEVTGVTRDDR